MTLKQQVCYEPCANCPFRTDIAPFLSKWKAMEIVRGMRERREFLCHKTLNYRDGVRGKQTPNTRTCAGYAVICENEGLPTLKMMIAAPMGLYDRARLNMDAPVHKTAAAFIAANAEPSL